MDTAVVKLHLDAEVKVFRKEQAKLLAELTRDLPVDTDIEARVHSIRVQYESMNKSQDQYLEYLLEEDADEYLNERERKADYRTELEILEVKAARILTELSKDNREIGNPAPRSDVGYRVNLPQRKLQEFSGDVRDWLGFWSSFEDIDQDTGISDADKFQYLLQCVPKTSPARKCIEGFTVSAKNYRAAVETLKNLYGRDRMLIKVYVRDLLQLVIKNAIEGSKMEFMDLYPKLSSHIRNLEELGVTSDKCEEILYPVVESCLPEDILLAWQRNPSYDEKLDELMKFLNVEVHNKMDRSLAKMQFLTVPESTLTKKANGKIVKNEVIPTASGFMATYAPEKEKGKYNKEKRTDKYPCGFCGDTRHLSEHCGRAKTQMTMEERLQALKERKCCFKCLIPGHSAKKCKRFVRCCICMGQHYEVVCNKMEPREQGTMMAASHHMEGYDYGRNCPPETFMDNSHHQPTAHSNTTQHGPFQQAVGRQLQQRVTRNETPQSGVNQRTGMSNITEKRTVTLGTLMAVMETPKGKWRVRIFMDDGSDDSHVEEECAYNTGCVAVGSQVVQHQLFGGIVTEPEKVIQYRIKLTSLDGSQTGTFLFNSKPKIAKRIRKPQPGSWMEECLQKGITFPAQDDTSEEVQLLFGMDVVAQILTGGFHRIDPMLIARETIFGWVLGGTQHEKRLSAKLKSTNLVTTMMISNYTVEELWSLDALGISEDSKSETKEDLEKATVAHFKKTVKRQSDGRYIVELPWKEGHKKLNGNFNQAFYRLKNVTTDLQKQGYWNAYDKVFLDWEQRGIIEEATKEALSNVKDMYLLPHRHVVKENSSTTPVRPVFDASAKGKGGPSLNDCLEKGPNMLERIPAVMCRFRKERIGSVSDIEKAYLQMEISREHQEFLHFIWWQDSACKILKLYRHRRAVFGVSPSPFLLAATLQHHLENECCASTDLVKKLINSLYVDNSCSSHSSMEVAKDFQDKSQGLLTSAHFNLRGWEFSFSKEEKLISVLGMTWESKSDTISLCLDSTKKRLNGPRTKRGLLSVVNSVFDPLGYACAFTILPKLLLQECCNLKLEWDDELPEEIAVKIRRWEAQVPDLEKMKIPRWLNIGRTLEGVSVHCCNDASGIAFATCVYVRIERGDFIGVQLVMAKSRVAPIKKKITIPRMELLGCEIGALLTVNSVVKFLELEDVPLFFWTDSTTALAWIQRDKDWARFVANRVAVIRRLTRIEDWHHVPGEINPADVPSRGCSAIKLVETRFWEGPEWLRQPREFWPSSITTVKEEDVDAERKKNVVSFHVKRHANMLQQLLRYSDYYKILRIMSYVFRFVDLLKVKKKSSPNRKLLWNEKGASLQAIEIQRAENCLLRLLQRESFKGLDDERLRKMGAFMDSIGLIRVKSQLLFGNEDFGVRCPIVLPHDHELVKSLIRKEHCLHSHAGVQILQASLRNRFWILRCRRTVSGVVNSCPICRRFTAKKCEVQSAPLPLDRIRDTVAFDVTGVDLAGPLLLRGGHKAWIVLFTCAVYRAVHLELVTSLSTEGFLMSLRRFVSRRGRPSTIYSDNGLNFVGCNNLFKRVDWEKVLATAAVERITWKFNPPTASWWGGFWERLVGLTKQLLRRVLGKSSVDYEELLTLLCDVEASLNQRPLTFVSDQKEELLPLCPAQFMRDNPHSSLPEAEIVDARSLKATARYCQKLRVDLRGRFRKEYLGQLKHNESVSRRSICVVDVVIIEDDNKKRIDWLLGVVKETYPGRDGQVRTALVKTKDGDFLRAIQRLYLMEVSEEDRPDTADTPSSGKEGEKSRFGRTLTKPKRLGIS